MSSLPDDIKHVVVLMLENRSFDHMLGGLPGVEGPAGLANIDPDDGTIVPVTFDAGPSSPAVPDPAKPGEVIGDPIHDFLGVNRQLFETAHPGAATPITCGGFIRAARESGDPNAETVALEVMRCYDTEKSLVTMAALARDFVVCDHWHASVPGPTWPNRLFCHAATSWGYLDNKLRGYPGPTIYDLVAAAGLDWAIYYHDVAQAICIPHLWRSHDKSGRESVRSIDDFYKEVKSHSTATPTLPSYLFLEPGYFEPARGLREKVIDFFKWIGHAIGIPVKPSRHQANDQHAPHDVRLGEHLIADVYDALRANPDVWNHCMLIVVHDEHGGLFDHVHPPSVPPTTDHPSQDPSFVFDRLGLRVPALLISPFLDPGVDSTTYEHVSIVRTVREHFCPDAAPLNARDAGAPLLSPGFRTTPRQDTPKRMTRPTAIPRIPQAGEPAVRPMTDLQFSLVHLASVVAAEPASASPAAATESGNAGLREAPQEAGVINWSDRPAPVIGSEFEGREYVLKQSALRR